MHSRTVRGAVAVACALLLSAPAVADEDPEIRRSPVVSLAPGESDRVREGKAARVVPSATQLMWQRQQLTAFVHFTTRTFVDKPQPDGRLSPTVFNPSDLDTDQWARVLRAGGYRHVVLTVKHGDGFLLYPSAYSTYSVARSPYRNGKGDVLREFTDSMRRAGLSVGFYFSPPNRHELNVERSRWKKGYPRYGYSEVKGNRACPVPERRAPGRPSFTFRTDEYNCLFLRQLYEIFTQYGPVSEWWLDEYVTSHTPRNDSRDAFVPPPGVTGDPTQRFDTTAWWSLAEALQPGIPVFNGWGLRWVGNEQGFARVGGEWSTIAVRNQPGTGVPQFTAGAPGDRETWDGATHLVWMPTEVDVPMSAGGNWSWNPGEQQKSPEQLWHIYVASVGRNANLLLNFGPDRSGRIPEDQEERALGLRQRISRVFGNDVAGTARTSVSADGRIIERRLARPTTFNWIGLREDVARHGQRVESYRIEAWDSRQGSWRRLTTTTWNEKGRVIPDIDARIGFQRYQHLEEPTTTRRVRVVVTESRREPHVSALTLHRD
ncbi:alpha-L-fucosidase [Streptomyces indicus]|uniref:alpha-L-fucosidase n=1 Tax=Streptomyces indicus TaxID=417292 RepID=A0A1G9DZ05_9ACTN|nr:alpha-L-fucosidase [Streptomyces indicus]